MGEMEAIKIPITALDSTVTEGLEELHLVLFLKLMEEMVVRLIRIIALQDYVAVTEAMEG
jgi:hypothetical protein